MAKKLQVFLSHERHVDGEREQMTRAYPIQRRGQSTEGTARGGNVPHKLHVARPPAWISSCRKKNFRWVSFAQAIEVNLPEQFSMQNACRLGSAHAARLAA